jgi:uncharacterized membrane protein
MFESLAALAQPWADLYASNTTLSTAVIAVHILGMFVGGGMAIGADRSILRAAPGSAEAVRAVVADLSSIHSVIIGALVVTFASGAALFASDVATFSVAKVYWVKMAFVALLLVNGVRMRRAERAVLHPLANIPIHTTEMPVVFPKREWNTVRSSALVSVALWLSIVLLGVVLTNNG